MTLLIVAGIVAAGIAAAIEVYIFDAAADPLDFILLTFFHGCIWIMVATVSLMFSLTGYWLGR